MGHELDINTHIYIELMTTLKTNFRTDHFTNSEGHLTHPMGQDVPCKTSLES